VGTLARSSVDRPFDEKRFDLVIEVDPTSVDLRPEMTARADVVVGTKDGALLVPLNAVFDDHGTLVAHVVRPLGIETRAVEVGESNDLLVEVASGLKEGDQVMLTDPGRAGNGAATMAQPAAGGAASKMKGGAGRDNALSPR
jgi:multidrug efflux pump subunit AcrA (membrane-fusion protein)